MNAIFTIQHPFNDVTSIDIFTPSRGTSGTLSYPVRINNCMAFFEMNDEGDWEIVSRQMSFASEVLNLVNHLIFNEEKKRFQLNHAIKMASIAQV